MREELKENKLAFIKNKNLELTKTIDEIETLLKSNNIKMEILMKFNDLAYDIKEETLSLINEILK